MSHAMSEVKSWLEHLDYIVPCSGVLVAGSGFGGWVAELDALNIPRALFVEAQNSKIERMKKLYDLPQNWQAVQGVLWREEAEISFYEISNSALSGIVSPETFRDIWPNATTLNVESFNATTLKNVVEEYDPESSINWLVVDCFPAVKILQGALEKLDQYDLILARAVSQEEVVAGLGLQKKELNTFLEEQGFRQIVTFEETSPSVGLVLYTRDVNMTLKKELETKADELHTLQTKKRAQRVEFENELAQIKQELEAKVDELKVFQTKQEEQKEQVEKLKSENEQLKQERDELSAQKTQLSEAKKQLEQKVTEAATQKEEQQKILTEKENALFQHEKESDEKSRLLQEQIKAEEKIRNWADNLKKSFDDKELQIEEFKITVADLETKLNENKAFEHDVYEFKRSKNYYIKPEYQSTTEYVHYDDKACEDEWQLEVYLHALGLMKKYDLHSVVDVGCGSAYKLMHYLSEYETTGLELEVNLEFLKNKYPDRVWLKSNFDINHRIDTDVVICSDVIEHIVNPDQLIQYIQTMRFKYLVLSTPDRDLVYEDGSKFRDGPPRNPAHVREWNFLEFNDYISQYFEIIDHRVTNLKQSTQTMICRKR